MNVMMNLHLYLLTMIDVPSVAQPSRLQDADKGRTFRYITTMDSRRSAHFYTLVKKHMQDSVYFLG